MRRLEVHLKEGDAFDAVIRAVKHFDPIDYSIVQPEQDNRRLINVLVRDGASQELVDAIQSTLESERDWRLNVIAVEASLPNLQTSTNGKEERNTQATREEILLDIGKAAVFDRDFAILVVLSTVVAAVGMNSGSVAGVIGAMVIAPLLGPILAFAMGAALGDIGLIKQSGVTLLSGIAIALLSGLALAFVVPIDLSSTELTSRAEVRLDAVALALSAGGAAALSVAKGQGSGLVGVMVAAALLPPGAAMGLFLGSGEIELGARAGLLLTLNVACLVLGA
ncbi:MAG: TIGR00341 family protein [Pseudomonadota bacterium]